MQILDKTKFIKEKICQKYPSFKQIDLNDFIDFLLSYIEEQDLQRFDSDKCQELAELIAGTILDFFGGYIRITKWW